MNELTKEFVDRPSGLIASTQIDIVGLSAR